MERVVTNMALPKKYLQAVLVPVPILGNGLSARALPAELFPSGPFVTGQFALGLLDRLMIRLRLIIGLIE